MTSLPIQKEEDDKPVVDPYEVGCWWLYAIGLGVAILGASILIYCLTLKDMP